MPTSARSVKPRELPEVLAALRRLDAPALALRDEPVRLTGGFWAEMWTLHLRDHGEQIPPRVVLRLAPDARAAESETAVQRAIADTGFPTPRILAAADATSESRFWAVMEHADGAPLLAGLSGIGALARLPQLARDLPRQLASVIARLHEVPVAPIEAALAGCADQRAGIDGLLDHYASIASDVGDVTLIRGVDELAGLRPPGARKVVCHGDLHPFNVLQHERDLTVLDWTASRIADPAFDISFTTLLLANPPLAAPRQLRPVIRRASQALARRFVRAYDAIAVRPVDAEQLAWHTRLHSLRVLAEVARWRADGNEDAHRGHPWFAMEPALRKSFGGVTA
jgi:aminoglycoside phosphotransferase (APT) family kinase protein